MALVIVLLLLALLGVGLFALARRRGDAFIERITMVASLVFGAASLAVAVFGSPFDDANDPQADDRILVDEAPSTTSSSLPAFSGEVNNQASLANLVAFLEAHVDQRIRLDVSISDGWAFDNISSQGVVVDPAGQVVGSIGEPGCTSWGLPETGSDCYGFDLFVIGQQPDDVENGFHWEGQDRHRLRGAFLNLGATHQLGSEWGLQIVRTPIVP